MFKVNYITHYLYDKPELFHQCINLLSNGLNLAAVQNSSLKAKWEKMFGFL